MWIFVIFLYGMRLSTRLNAPLDIVFNIFMIFASGYFLGSFLSKFLSRKVYRNIKIDNSRESWNNAIGVLCALLILSVIEIVIEGFIPAISMAMGRDISHFDFGIASVHGLILAGLSAIGSYMFAIFCGTGNKKALWIAAIPILYAVLFVSRKMFTVCFLQYLLIFLYTRSISFKTIIRSLVVILAFVFIFGAFGDLRGRTSTIETYGGLDPRFEFVGDEGFQWVYLYVTTPLQNLAFTTLHFPSEGNTLPKRTYGPLLPSALSGDTEGMDRFHEVGAERYWLESKVFNVSTGFNEPYLDYGFYGIFFHAAFIGFLVSITFLRFRGTVGLVTYCALLTGSLLTIFSNTFGNLNYVGQFAFFLLLLYPIQVRFDR